MAGNHINIGSLLFDVGLDPAQVAKLTSDLRQVGEQGQRSFERTKRTADPLKQSVAEVRNQILGLRNAYVNGTISEQQFRVEMTRLKTEATGLARDLPKTSNEFRVLHTAAATAERGLATLRGEQSKLGLAQQVNIALSHRVNTGLRAMGPAGSAAAFGLGLVGSAAARTNVLLGAGLLLGLGAVTFGMHKGLMKASEYASEIDDMRQRTGLAADTLQELRFATEQNGVAFEKVERSIESFTRRIPQIQDGTGHSARAFQSLGLSLEDANGQLRHMSDLYPELLSRLASVENETQRNAIGTQLLGRNYQELIPLLNQGEKGLAKLAERARELGLVMGEDSITDLVSYANRVAAIKDQWAALFRELSLNALPIMEAILSLVESGLVPALRKQADRLSDVADRFFDAGEEGKLFREQIERMLVPFAQLADVTVAAGQGFRSFTGFVFGGVVATGAAIGDLIGQIETSTQLFAILAKADTIDPRQAFAAFAEAREFIQENGLELGVDFEQVADAGADAGKTFFDSAEAAGLDAGERLARALTAGYDFGLGELARDPLRLNRTRTPFTPPDDDDPRDRGEPPQVTLARFAQRARFGTDANLEAFARSQTAEAARGSDRQFMSLPGSVHSVGPAAVQLEIERSIREAGERQALAIAESYVSGMRSAERDLDVDALRLLGRNAADLANQELQEGIAEGIRLARIALASPTMRSQGIGFGGAEARSTRGTEALRELGRQAAADARREAAAAEQVSSQRVTLTQGLIAAERELNDERVESIRLVRLALAEESMLSQGIGFGGAEAGSTRATGALRRIGQRGSDAGFNARMGGSAIRDDRFRGDGGLTELLEEAGEEIARVEEQIASLAGTGPSQFDEMRDAVTEFGKAAGLTDDEIAEMVATIDGLEEQQALITSLNDVSRAAKAMGSTIGGVAGEMVSSFGDIAAGAASIASGDTLGGILTIGQTILGVFQSIGEGMEAFNNELRAMEEAGVASAEEFERAWVLAMFGITHELDKLRRELELSQQFSLIDPEGLVQTKQVRKSFGPFGWLEDVIDETATQFHVSIAEALEGGVLSGLRNGFAAYMESGDIKDLEAGIKEGLQTAITDALFESLINEAIIKGALGPLLTEMAEAFAAGDTARAQQIAAEIDAMIPGLAADMAAIADQFSFLRPDQDPDTGGTSSSPTGISIPVAPNSVLAAPAWVPEFGGYVTQLGDHVDRFGRNVRNMPNDSSRIARDLLRSN